MHNYTPCRIGMCPGEKQDRSAQVNIPYGERRAVRTKKRSVCSDTQKKQLEDMCMYVAGNVFSSLFKSQHLR